MIKGSLLNKQTTIQYRGIITARDKDKARGSDGDYRLEAMEDLRSASSGSAEKHDFVFDSVL